MHRYLHTGVRLTVLGCAAIAIALVLSACGGADPQPEGDDDHGGHDHSHALPSGDGPQPGASPDESATEALHRIYSWEPATDADSGDGMRRAVPWLSGALRTVATRGGHDDSVRALPQWQQWRTNHDIVIAAVKVTARVDRPGALDVERRALITQDVLHADGTSTPWRLLTVDIALSRDDDQRWRMWRMDLIDTTTLGAAQ